MDQSRARSLSIAGLGCGVFAALSAVWVYWLVVPGILFGIAAIVLGAIARREGPSEPATVAIILGIVALLLVPSVLFVADEAESYGRDCALDPADC